jgi:hypothetical protein
VTIHDLLGVVVETLAYGVHMAGDHSAHWDATGRPSGVYFCRITAGEESETVRMLLVR